MTRTRHRPDNAEFSRRTEPYRRELLAHCYRMLGSVHDAEDLVQETYLRAWRAYDRFEGRSSLRTWLYQIATNACLSTLAHRSRRVLPSGLGGPATDPDAPVEPGGPGVAWLEPIPDALVSPESADPAAIVAARDGVRLALIACLQHLPARQRAVLLLRDVLAWPAAEVAEALGLSTAAVKSLLQRARSRMSELDPAGERPPEPGEPAARAVLEQYMAAFEHSDPRALERLLRADASLEMVPQRTWFAGRATCLPYLTAHAIGSPGDWRMVAVRANGQPAAVAYLRDTDGAYRALGVAVLTTTATELVRITLFGDPELAGLFGSPPVLL